LKKVLTQEQKRGLSGYVFMLPWVLGFAVLILYPLVLNMRLSLGKINDVVGLKTQWVGLDNYYRLFNENTDFVPALLDTIQKTFLWSPFIIVFSLFLAILLNRNMPGKGFFRMVFFMPVLLGSGYVMQQLGPAANVLLLSENAKVLLRDYFSEGISEFMIELLSQIMSVFWKCGVQIVIFLSGLQSIPDSYYEAARVDNANSWDCFWKITLPMISPIILLNTIFTVIDTFRNTDNKIANLVVSVIFDDANYEYGAAMGWVYFLVTSVIIGLIFLCSRKLVTYEK